MKKIILVLILFCCCFLSNAAQINNSFNLSIFYGELKTPDKNISGLDETAQVKHSVGGYGYEIAFIRYMPTGWMRLARNIRFGLQGSYANYSDNTYGYGDTTQFTYSSSSLSALAVVKFIFNKNFALLGKAGAAKVNQTLDNSGYKTTLSRFHPQFSLGTAYLLNPHLQLGLAFNYISGETPNLGANNKTAPIETYNFFASYLF